MIDAASAAAGRVSVRMRALPDHDAKLNNIININYNCKFNINYKLIFANDARMHARAYIYMRACICMTG